MLFPVVKGGKWGYMDQAGKVVIEPKYDGAWDFSEGLAAVGEGLNRGFIDRTGKMVISPRFGWTSYFHNGLAAVYAHRDGKPMGSRGADIWGDDLQMYKPQANLFYTDKTGKIVDGGGCSPLDFSEGKACCRGVCMSLDGKRITHDAEELGRFSDGLVAARKGCRWGYMDQSMKWVIEPQFAAAGAFREDRAPVAESDPPPPDNAGQYRNWVRRRSLKWGYIDKTGKMAITPRFVEAQEFSEGLAAVVPVADFRNLGGGSVGLMSKKAGKAWGYAGKSGAMEIKAQFDYAWPFSEGLGRVMVKEKHGYVDKEGRYVVDPKYDAAWEFSRGLARICVGDKEGYIDSKGKLVWEPSE